MEVHDVMSIDMSLIYEILPNTDGLRSASGAPLSYTSINFDDPVVMGLVRVLEIHIRRC